MMYGWRKTREKGERFLRKRERHGGESLEVQGVTVFELNRSWTFLIRTFVSYFIIYVKINIDGFI